MPPESHLCRTPHKRKRLPTPFCMAFASFMLWPCPCPCPGPARQFPEHLALDAFVRRVLCTRAPPPGFGILNSRHKWTRGNLPPQKKKKKKKETLDQTSKHTKARRLAVKKKTDAFIDCSLILSTSSYTRRPGWLPDPIITYHIPGIETRDSRPLLQSHCSSHVADLPTRFSAPRNRFNRGRCGRGGMMSPYPATT